MVAEESQTIDLKALRQRLGAANLSFAKPERLLEVLGVTPGTVTPFAVINDSVGAVRVVLDQALATAPQASFHPLDNAQTTTTSGAGLLAFLDAVQHPPLLIDFTLTTAPASA